MISFETLDSKSLGEAVLSELQGKIISSELKAGDWLPPEREMAEQMGVSRGCLHQVILALESQGFVSIVPRRGTRICDYRKHPTPQSLAVIMNYSGGLDKNIFRDMMDFRIWLEGQCARLACRNIYESTLDEMQSIADRLSLSGDDPAELTGMVCRFHYLLVRASGNSIFSMVFRGFEPAVVSLTRQRFEIMRDDLPVLGRKLGELLRCIREKDEDGAEHAVSEILREGIAYLEQQYI